MQWKKRLPDSLEVTAGMKLETVNWQLTCCDEAAAFFVDEVIASA
jgi:hypothetical protein